MAMIWCETCGGITSSTEAVGRTPCSCRPQRLYTLDVAIKEIDSLNLQIGELKEGITGMFGRFNAECLRLETDLKEKDRLNGVYRVALETIAAVDPRYPDGDAMSDEMCAKIALGRNCGFCGSTLPCQEHKEQHTEKRKGEPECDCVVPALDGAGQHSPSCAIFKGR